MTYFNIEITVKENYLLPRNFSGIKFKMLREPLIPNESQKKSVAKTLRELADLLEQS